MGTRDWQRTQRASNCSTKLMGKKGKKEGLQRSRVVATSELGRAEGREGYRYMYVRRGRGRCHSIGAGLRGFWIARRQARGLLELNARSSLNLGRECVDSYGGAHCVWPCSGSCSRRRRCRCGGGRGRLLCARRCGGGGHAGGALIGVVGSRDTTDGGA